MSFLSKKRVMAFNDKTFLQICFSADPSTSTIVEKLFVLLLVTHVNLICIQYYAGGCKQKNKLIFRTPAIE